MSPLQSPRRRLLPELLKH
ncbi:hypothetical protein EJF18_10175 [Clavispora lusitaniae]|uniref:Uncharacterized protein n=1 Tax=Clavispora lusitaniae TaxID=36911 RepID=A0ACD0WCV8_CLALS|nr:hypothetical protein EJF14_10175 [Clavispora lusitaniae]QFZ31607.1 hypothetical protein EJF16_10175 [Clavispora lusitaniae]QFZ37275.1 hypothetical protein EJF15_10175 [Clavispora lusitaniae]QFZ42959.1 hypothetical protein EJF18_10175 [Clavispora lusitaniae]QFZ48635.1 hypothetical protein EJF17_10175 [Clavispora lusitaniae]